MEEHQSTSELIRQYDECVVTSFGKPFADMVLVDGEGVYVTDLEGRKYLDFWSGVTVTVLGHRHPRVQEAVRGQMDRLVHCASHSYYSVPALELAKRLIAIAPMKPAKASFHTSGTEANDLALKMAKRYAKRHEVIGLQGSYHSWGYHAGVPGTPTAYYKHAAPDLGPSVPGIYYAPAPYCYRCPLGLTYPNCALSCARAVEAIITHTTSRDVAAFLAETIQGVGGIVTPPEGYFREVKAILDRHGILLILDEVQTRLGITGHLWGAQAYGVTPDIVTTAKALGNGWPISAVLARRDVADSLEDGDHYSTWGANPVMCAAASATVDTIVEGKLWENSRQMGELLAGGLKELQGRCDLIGEVRGKGLMIGLEVVRDRVTKEPGPQEAKAVRRACADEGLIVGLGGWWGNVIRIQPPMVIGPGHVQEALAALEKACVKVQKEARAAHRGK